MTKFSKILAVMASAVMSLSMVSALPASGYASAESGYTVSAAVKMSACTVKLGGTSYQYTGSAIKPSVTVKYGSTTLKNGTDYTVAYSNNKNVGTATATITGKGKYTGTKKLTYTIYAIKAPATVTVKAAASTKAALSWSRSTGAAGYYVQRYNASKKAYQTIKTTTALSFTDTGLTANTTYKYRVGAYRKTGSNTYVKYSPEYTVKTLTVAQEYQNEVLRLVNVERQKAGLTALKSNTVLNTVAAKRAAEIKVEFSHSYKGSSGRAGAWLDYYKFNWNTWGENIAAGQKTPQEVVNAWMNSSGHRKNILNKNYKQLGIAFNDRYWVQVFTN